MTKTRENFAPDRVVYKFTHWTYLLILFSIVAYFAYYVYLGFVTYDGFGHVKVKKTTLSASFDGKIKELPLVEGQSFEKGVLVAKLKPALLCELPKQEEVKDNKRVVQLGYDIQVNQIRVRVLKNNRLKYAGIDEEQALRRALELDDKYSQKRTALAKLDDELFFCSKS